MNVRPLIVRELRAEARRANTYWVRALAAALLTALFVYSAWSYSTVGGSLGPLLFNALSDGLLLSILVIVSAITADTISREKREGTLGLLFLTPLTARDIVVGKSLLHCLRAVAIFVAVVPIVGLPFLLGGISFEAVTTFLVMVPAAVMIAVASGILASVYTTEWIQSIVWAEMICAMFAAAFVFFELASFYYISSTWWLRKHLAYWWLVPTIAAIPYAAVILRMVVSRSGKVLARTWQVESTEIQPWWVNLFSKSKFWRAAFHWDTRKARERNPIAWLQEYNWTSRLTKWGWCILLFAAQWKLVLGWRQFMDYQMTLYRLVAFGIAFSAAASFRRERQTGALELLLVTPISAGQLILGRLQGVWIHFFPAIAILGCVWTMGPQFLSLPLYFSWYLAGAYFCIPIIGFYCSLLTSNVLVAWLLTLFFGQYLPYAMTQAYRFEIGRRNMPMAFAAVEAVFALLAGLLLYEHLISRRFVSRR